MTETKTETKVKTTTVRVRPIKTEHLKGHSVTNLEPSDGVEVMVYGDVRAFVRITPKLEVVWREDERYTDKALLDTVRCSLGLMAMHFGTNGNGHS